MKVKAKEKRRVGCSFMGSAGEFVCYCRDWRVPSSAVSVGAPYNCQV